jgi:hypothetical protein
MSERLLSAEETSSVYKRIEEQRRRQKRPDHLGGVSVQSVLGQVGPQCE